MNDSTQTTAAPRSDSAAPAKPDSDMQAVLDELAALGGKPIETLAPAEARKQPTPADAAKSLLQKQNKPTAPDSLVPGITAADRTIPGPGGPLAVRIYTPAGSGPFPVVAYYHGGGFVIADKEVYDGGARALAKQANAVVVSVDYRRAPEHKFPAAHEDALATYQWARSNAASIKGDPNKIAVAGESAGGNLAVATALMARDKGLPLPVHVVSVYPIAQTDTTTDSYERNANAKPLSRAMMGWFTRQLIRSAEDLNDPRLDLVHADLHGLPPVTIINAEIDPLLDDGAMLEAALRSAGVPVTRRVYEGATHEFFGMSAVVQDARDAVAVAGSALRKAFEK
ncbi:MAG: alpha/beta hydrolase [Gemmatimonadota bacterium]